MLINYVNRENKFFFHIIMLNNSLNLKKILFFSEALVLSNVIVLVSYVYLSACLCSFIFVCLSVTNLQINIYYLRIFLFFFVLLRHKNENIQDNQQRKRFINCDCTGIFMFEIGGIILS